MRSKADMHSDEAEKAVRDIRRVTSAESYTRIPAAISSNHVGNTQFGIAVAGDGSSPANTCPRVVGPDVSRAQTAGSGQKIGRPHAARP